MRRLAAALKHCSSRGQNLTEFVVVGAVVLAALVGMQTYLRRGIQARLKTSTDNLLAITNEDATATDPARRGEATQRFGSASSQQALDATGEIANFTTTFDSTMVEEKDGRSGILSVRRASQGPEITTRSGTQRTRQFETPQGSGTPTTPPPLGGS